MPSPLCDRPVAQRLPPVILGRQGTQPPPSQAAAWRTTLTLYPCIGRPRGAARPADPLATVLPRTAAAAGCRSWRCTARCGHTRLRRRCTLLWMPAAA